MSFATRRLGIQMNQGDDFSVIITVSDSLGPINLTSYEFFGEMKIDTSPDTAVAAEFDFNILTQSGATLGQVQWVLSNSETSALLASVSDSERKKRLTTPYVFDVKMKDVGGLISRIIEGIIYLSPQVTQESAPPVP